MAVNPRRSARVQIASLLKRQREKGLLAHRDRKNAFAAAVNGLFRKDTLSTPLAVMASPPRTVV
jgi:hypothetical protein